MNPPPQGAISGKISAAPNPLPLEAESRTTITWQTNDPCGAAVHVRTPESADPQLLSDAREGVMHVDWIKPNTTYDFLLYGLSEPATALDKVTVRRLDIPWDAILNYLRSEQSWSEERLQQTGEFIAKAVPLCLQHQDFLQLFRLWEEHGFHVTPVHFYQPIPDTRSLPKRPLRSPPQLPGIDLNRRRQIELLRNGLAAYRGELEQIALRKGHQPGVFDLTSRMFPNLDACISYCMARHFKPQRIIEVGSGHSSLGLAEALIKNGGGSLTCIEPFPPDFVVKGFPGLTRLIQAKVETIGLDFFSELEAGDVLFIDSSHVVKSGGDVNYLFFEIIPRLKPGTLVHLHDIFLPFDYPPEWMRERLRFWTEQYMLQAFLTFNSEFEVLISIRYAVATFPDELRAVVPPLPDLKGASFWMRRKPPGGAG